MLGKPAGRYGDVLPSHWRFNELFCVIFISGPSENPKTPRDSGRPHALTRSRLTLPRTSPCSANQPPSLRSRLRPAPTKLPSVNRDAPERLATRRADTRVSFDVLSASRSAAFMTNETSPMPELVGGAA